VSTVSNTKLIAEIGINANGDVDMAKELIDIAAISGCYGVKFQKRDIDFLYTQEELDKYLESPWGATVGDYKRAREFGLREYKEIDKYCKYKGIAWFATPWDVNSVEFLSQFDIPYIKVASASLTDKVLLKKIKGTGKKVILSTGMSSIDELNAALEIFGDTVEYILSCTSSYPTPVKDVNLKRLSTLKDMYGDKYKIGYSNHYAGIIFIVAAYLLGAEMLEYHITLDRSMYGTDQASSIEPPGCLKIGKYVETLQNGMGSGSVGCLESEIPIRKKLRKDLDK